MDRTRTSYKIEIEPGSITGFYVRTEGHIVACFSTAAELALWIEQEFSPLDLEPERDTMPAMLKSDESISPDRPGWRLLRGKRA